MGFWNEKRSLSEHKLLKHYKMSFFESIDINKLPTHIAIIMDGNGRWAKNKNLERSAGHVEGVSAVRRLIEASTKVGLKFVTLYTFSTENWKRPKEEIDALMDLMVQAVARETPDLIKNNVRLLAIGNLDRLPERTRKALEDSMQQTSRSTGVTAVLALSYSSRWEIVEAAKKIGEAYKAGQLSDVTEDTIENYLSTSGIPNPDLLIRTGGEKRISNFLLWQMAYTELYFIDTLWPDFVDETLYEAIAYYQGRERRFGQTSEQIQV